LDCEDIVALLDVDPVEEIDDDELERCDNFLDTVPLLPVSSGMVGFKLICGPSLLPLPLVHPLREWD